MTVIRECPCGASYRAVSANQERCKRCQHEWRKTVWRVRKRAEAKRMPVPVMRLQHRILEGVLIEPDDRSASEITAILADAERHTKWRRLTGMYTVDGWAQKAPMDWDV